MLARSALFSATAGKTLAAPGNSPSSTLARRRRHFNRLRGAFRVAAV